mmetsp:Transcript_64461/g.130993  ORF Transcript_64461/g.130993 Transcript_64461/m.130993 type:complete len:216 (+) Transcript_64461:71-718(+)
MEVVRLGHHVTHAILHDVFNAFGHRSGPRRRMQVLRHFPGARRIAFLVLQHILHRCLDVLGGTSGWVRHNWPAATGIHQFGIFKLVPEACIADHRFAGQHAFQCATPATVRQNTQQFWALYELRLRDPGVHIEMLRQILWKQLLLILLQRPYHPNITGSEAFIQRKDLLLAQLHQTSCGDVCHRLLRASCFFQEGQQIRVFFWTQFPFLESIQRS